MFMRSNACILLLAVVVRPSHAQPPPNFSGTWKLNASESNLTDRRVAAPDSLIWKIEQRGDHFSYTIERVGQSKKSGFTAQIDIGGGPFESDEAGIITARWQGPNLLVDTLYNPGNERRASMEEVWTLGENGTKLIDNVVYHVPKNAKNQADVIFKRVFEKQ
jgi:hypothetical protein